MRRLAERCEVPLEDAAKSRRLGRLGSALQATTHLMNAPSSVVWSNSGPLTLRMASLRRERVNLAEGEKLANSTYPT